MGAIVFPKIQGKLVDRETPLTSSIRRANRSTAAIVVLESTVAYVIPWMENTNTKSTLEVKLIVVHEIVVVSSNSANVTLNLLRLWHAFGQMKITIFIFGTTKIIIDQHLIRK